jgi:ribonuclease HI
LIIEFSSIPKEEEVSLEKPWIAYVDGSATRKYSGAGVIFIGPNKEECETTIQFQFTNTSNEVEYEAMIVGMNIAREMGVKNLELRSDSQVVVGHVKGEHKAHREKMNGYLENVKEIMRAI